MFLDRSSLFWKRPEACLPYPENIMPQTYISEVYKRDTGSLKRKLEQKRSPSYRSMEKLKLLL